MIDWRRFIADCLLKQHNHLPTAATAGVIVLFLMAASAACFAQGAEEASATAKAAVEERAPRRIGGPYCGVYCLFSLLRAYEKPCALSDLVKPEYISKVRGSTLEDLEGAAEDFGLHAVVMKNLTTRDLRKIAPPCILHVRPADDIKEYRHFIVYLGVEPGGMARIYDPPLEPAVIPFRDLALRWNGRGMVVSDAPVDVAPIRRAGQARFALYAGIALGAVLALRYVGKRWGRRLVPVRARVPLIGLSYLEAFAVWTVCVGAGFGYHYAREEGLLAHADGTESIVALYRGAFIPKIDKKRLETMRSNGGVVVIDARRSRDFERGHIENAVSVPVGSGDAERRAVVQAIPKDAAIVVYCQSARCTFAEHVAIQLLSDGFDNVSIFKGGWVEWSAKET